MLSGNFGKQNMRMDGLCDTKWNTFWMVNTKTFRFWRFDHGGMVLEPCVEGVSLYLEENQWFYEINNS